MATRQYILEKTAYLSLGTKHPIFMKMDDVVIGKIKRYTGSEGYVIAKWDARLSRYVIINDFFAEKGEIEEFICIYTGGRKK